MARGPHPPHPAPRPAPADREREWADETETEAASVPDDASAAERPALFLFVREGERLAFVDLRDPGGWGIGRSPQAEIVVDDRQVSRSHARLRLADGALAVDDLGSRNGTRVDGQALRGGTLRVGPGDTVEVGACQILVGARTAPILPDRADRSGKEPSRDVVLGDPEMARVFAAARKAARMPTTVLLLGETGTGKDVLAQRIHAWSPRAERPFVRINCAGIPETLLESELFGHERGAFTGADRRKEGYFEAASGGTLFLDEVGELTPGAQVKLLHVLENRTVTKLGGTAPVPVDVRVVCATHRDLKGLVAEERFRADLFYRISPFVLRIPPLRQRPAEVPLFANLFAARLGELVGATPPTLTPAALALLSAYDWPGNVRELRNAVEHAFVMSEGATLRPEHFAPEIHAHSRAAGGQTSADARRRAVDAERQAIEAALAAEGGNQTRAAVRLGIPRRTLVHKIARYRRRDGAE